MADLQKIQEKYAIEDKSLSELERSYKMGLGSKEKRAMFEKVNTPEAQKKAKDRRIATSMQAVRKPNFNKNDTTLKNDKGFVNMYRQAKNDLSKVSFEITQLEETSRGDKGLLAAIGKIRDAVKTYSRLLEQKGKGAISVR